MRSYHLIPVVFALISFVQAECCDNGKCVSWITVPGKPGRPDKEVCNRWKCADGHHHGWAGCCGLGACNVFCCNCDKKGGKVCRESNVFLAQGNEEHAELTRQSDEEMFEAANTGGNGDMSFAEFAAYFGADADDAALLAKFVLYDRNGDGYLQVGEMRRE